VDASDPPLVGPPGPTTSSPPDSITRSPLPNWPFPPVLPPMSTALLPTDTSAPGRITVVPVLSSAPLPVAKTWPAAWLTTPDNSNTPPERVVIPPASVTGAAPPMRSTPPSTRFTPVLSRLVVTAMVPGPVFTRPLTAFPRLLNTAPAVRSTAASPVTSATSKVVTVPAAALPMDTVLKFRLEAVMDEGEVPVTVTVPFRPNAPYGLFTPPLARRVPPFRFSPMRVVNRAPLERVPPASMRTAGVAGVE
jgi:hypothetical protein